VTNLADLAIRLFWLHLHVTDRRQPPFMKDWEAYGDVASEVGRLTPREQIDLLNLCLDLTVHFAVTCGAALGDECVGAVTRDEAGRGWATRTLRSELIGPTFEAIPLDGVSAEWTNHDDRRASTSRAPWTTEDHEARWEALLSAEPPNADAQGDV